LCLALKARLIAGFELVPNAGPYETPAMNRAFSAFIFRDHIPGAVPQARNEFASSTLNTYQTKSTRQRQVGIGSKA
jgi:hypothetical protein